eukprot:COSAG03_NODE_450_length_7830_cov_5.709352_8_plen_85_part_00
MGVFSFCSKLVLAVAVAGGAGFMLVPDILTGVSSDMTLQQWQIHAALVGFCLSPVSRMQYLVWIRALDTRAALRRARANVSIHN